MITNKSTNKVLCNSHKILTNIFSKAKGLMLSRKLKDTGYVFVFSKPRRVDLHMLFVFFPIDVIFLSESKKVIELKKNFLPFTLYISQHKAKYIIELPKGTIERTKTDLGHIISIH
jgi:uncharacterized membrane protein (UPF0127 family)